MALRNFFDLKNLDPIYYVVNSIVNFCRVRIDPYWAVLLDNASQAWRLVYQETDSCYAGMFRA